MAQKERNERCDTRDRRYEKCDREERNHDTGLLIVLDRKHDNADESNAGAADAVNPVPHPR